MRSLINTRLLAVIFLLTLLVSCCQDNDFDGGNETSKAMKCDNAHLYRFYNSETKATFALLSDDFEQIRPMDRFKNTEGYPQIGDPYDKIVIKGTFPDVKKHEYMFNPVELKKIARKNKQDVSEEYFSKLDKMEISTGFFFHGVGKGPEQMEARDGLCNSELNVDLRSYYEPADTRGFISLTRSPTLAKRHGQVDFMTKNPRKDGGWVYVIFVNGGYLDPVLPDKLEMRKNPKPDDPIFSLWQDQEVSQFAGIPWKFFIGYRKVTGKGKFEGPIYIRRGFKDAQPKAYTEIIASLSGAEYIDDGAVTRLLEEFRRLRHGM